MTRPLSSRVVLFHPWTRLRCVFIDVMNLKQRSNTRIYHNKINISIYVATYDIVKVTSVYFFFFLAGENNNWKHKTIWFTINMIYYHVYRNYIGIVIYYFELHIGGTAVWIFLLEFHQLLASVFVWIFIWRV